MAKDVAISVKGVHKSFRLPHEQNSGVKQVILNIFRRNRVKGYENQHVLKDITFDIKKGEFFGIVGRNGSGKSTLLKLLAGIYTQDKGGIKINGSLVPFIELGVGFNPELTGRENVFLNGALLGFSRRQMESMYDEIVEFAELERFMDQKLKNYSSGMQVRLAFSIAIRAESDILVLDEVLAVGDEAFQRKCYEYFAQLKRNKKTVILVTHSMDSVQQFCSKAMLINKGKIIEYGNPLKVASKYMELNSPQEISTSAKKPGQSDTHNKDVSADVKLKTSPSKLSFDISINSKTTFDDSVVTFVMNKSSGEKVFQWSTDDLYGKSISIKDGTNKVTLDIDNIFPDGRYDIQLAVKKADRTKIHALFNQIIVFEVINVNPLKRDSNWKPGVKVETSI